MFVYIGMYHSMLEIVCIYLLILLSVNCLEVETLRCGASQTCHLMLSS